MPVKVTRHPTKKGKYVARKAAKVGKAAKYFIKGVTETARQRKRTGVAEAVRKTRILRGGGRLTGAEARRLTGKKGVLTDKDIARARKARAVRELRKRGQTGVLTDRDIKRMERLLGK